MTGCVEENKTQENRQERREKRKDVQEPKEQALPLVESEGLRTRRNSAERERSLVHAEDLTGVLAHVTLANSVVRYLPEAHIHVSTSYYTGWLTEKCLESLYNLILGNIAGIWRMDDPNLSWERSTAIAEREMDDTYVSSEGTCNSKA